MSRMLLILLSSAVAVACTGDAKLGQAPAQSDSGTPDAGNGGTGPSDAADTAGSGGSAASGGADAGPSDCPNRCVPDENADRECARINQILDPSLSCLPQTTCCRILPTCESASGQCGPLTGGGLNCPSGTRPAPEIGYCGFGAGCCQ